MSSIFQADCEILAKEEIAPGIFRLALHSEEISKAAQPGQFVHVNCGAGRDFILRRPFGIHRLSPGNAFEILFQVRGKGTQALSGRRPHDVLDVLGPLGRPFTISRDLGSALVVAGGIGVAPLVYLATELAKRKIRFYVAQGALDAVGLYCSIDLKRVARQVFTSTEDGSAGKRGKVTDILHDAIRNAAPEHIYACGPEGMLKTVADIAAAYSIPCEVSIERRMACGVGACLSCVCKTEGGYRLACKDGPVFDAKELTWK